MHEMSGQGERRISIRLTPSAYRGLDRVCSAHGLTLTALVEAAGRVFDESPGIINQRITDLAREIDRERRARR